MIPFIVRLCINIDFKISLQSGFSSELYPLSSCIFCHFLVNSKYLKFNTSEPEPLGSEIFQRKSVFSNSVSGIVDSSTWQKSGDHFQLFPYLLPLFVYPTRSFDASHITLLESLHSYRLYCLHSSSGCFLSPRLLLVPPNKLPHFHSWPSSI